MISVPVYDTEIYRAENKTHMWGKHYVTHEEIYSGDIVWIRNVQPHPWVKNLMLDYEGMVYVVMK